MSCTSRRILLWSQVSKLLVLKLNWMRHGRKVLLHERNKYCFNLKFFVYFYFFQPNFHLLAENTDLYRSAHFAVEYRNALHTTSKILNSLKIKCPCDCIMTFRNASKRHGERPFQSECNLLDRRWWISENQETIFKLTKTPTKKFCFFKEIKLVERLHLLVHKRKNWVLNSHTESDIWVRLSDTNNFKYFATPPTQDCSAISSR